MTRTTMANHLGVATLLLLAGAVAISSAGKGTIVDISREQIKSINEEVEFNCTVQNLQNGDVFWFKYDNEHTGNTVLSANDNLYKKDKRFSLTVDKGVYSLKIKDLIASDTGFYECVIQFSDSTEKVSREVQLQMKRPPKIFKNVTRTITQSENSAVELKCNADGYPPPRISWKRENDVILPHGSRVFNGDVLKIPRVHKEDRGVYYCVAENGVSNTSENRTQDQANVTVRVEFAPTVTAYKPVRFQARGFDTQLKCDIEAWPAPNVTWHHNGKEIKRQDWQTNDDVIADVLRLYSVGDDDFGEYTCKAVNTYGSAQTKFKILEAQFPETE